MAAVGRFRQRVSAGVTRPTFALQRMPVEYLTPSNQRRHVMRFHAVWMRLRTIFQRQVADYVDAEFDWSTRTCAKTKTDPRKCPDGLSWIGDQKSTELTNRGTTRPGGSTRVHVVENTSSCQRADHGATNQ